MKNHLKLNVIVLFLSLICISANAQSTRKPVTNQYYPIVQKLSRDIVLSSQQKDIIKAKSDSIFQKHQNSKMGMKDTTFMKEMNAVRKDILEYVLTQDQKQVLRRKMEKTISTYKSSN